MFSRINRRKDYVYDICFISEQYINRIYLPTCENVHKHIFSNDEMHLISDNYTCVSSCKIRGYNFSKNYEQNIDCLLFLKCRLFQRFLKLIHVRLKVISESLEYFVQNRDLIEFLQEYCTYKTISKRLFILLQKKHILFFGHG